MIKIKQKAKDDIIFRTSVQKHLNRSKPQVHKKNNNCDWSLHTSHGLFLFKWAALGQNNPQCADVKHDISHICPGTNTRDYL